MTGYGFTFKLIAVSYIATHTFKITFVFKDIIYKRLFPRAEKLQLINLTPCTPVEMQLVSELDFTTCIPDVLQIIEEMDERFKDKEVEEMCEIIRTHLLEPKPDDNTPVQ